MGLEIGRYNVRRAIQINASPHQVWHEFYDIRRMGAWFGVGQSLDLYDPGKDGRVELSIEVDGEVQPFGGRIVVYDEDRELSFENNWFSEMAWPVPTMITLRLTANYEGTLVELFHHGFERLGKDSASEFQAYESAWDIRHLVELKHIVEGD